MNPFQLLDYPVVWECSRLALDFTIGLYRNRAKVIREWGLLESNPSVIDIGCGVGQYARLTEGNYLGIDYSKRYIDYARKRHGRANQSFLCGDAAAILNKQQATFDLALMVDVLHHLSDEECAHLLNIASRLAQQFVISFEPIDYQPHPVGQWIVEHDRGYHVRPLERLHQLFSESGLSIIKSAQLWLGPINTRAILACLPQSNAA